jgi:hypothetical protein
VAVVDHRPGTGWLTDAIAALAAHDRTEAIVYDALGPAADVGRLMEFRKTRRLEAVEAGDPRAACGAFIDAVREGRIRHDGDPELAAAAAGALTRTTGDMVFFDRRRSPVDVAPVIAATLAAHAASRPRPQPFII